MNKRNLQPKRSIRSILLVLLLCAAGMTNAFAANHDFTSIAPNGQTLYYKIISATEHTVMVTHPNDNTSGTYYSNANTYYGGEYIKYYNNPYFNYAFYGYGWTVYHYDKPSGNLIIPYYVEYNGISYSVTAIDEYAFGTTYSSSYACNGLTSVVIPASVQTIGSKAFAYCTELTTVTIPTSVTSIGDEVFRYCSNLVTVNFNATNCTSVGTNTWDDCTNFTTLNVGNTVTRIPNNGFQGASKITSVDLPNSVAIIGDYAFQNCSQLATINFPNALTFIGNNAFDGCSLLQSTSESQLLPNALETIGDYAFQNATTLAYLSIPSTLTSLGKYAFKSCMALNTVDYEATNCTYSGTQAEPPFFYCSALATITVSDNVTQIPSYCFKDCTALSSLTLGDSLAEIGAYAFYGCYGINSLVLPANLDSIWNFAFGNAFDQQLAHVESLNPTPPVIGSEAVFPTGQTIYVHMFSVNAYQIAENWSNYNIEGTYMDVEISAIANPPEGGTISGAGSILEGETCTLTATANSDYVFVNWTENNDIVSSEATYSFIVESDRNLVANFEMANHWTVSENFQNNMYILGVVMIDSIEQASPTFELGAFCNGECRGTEFPFEDGNRWLYFITIGGNIGEEITFRLYDHSLHQELDLYCFNMIPFEQNGLIGTDDPYEVLFAGMRNVSADVNLEGAGIVTGTGEYLYGTNVTLTAIANEGYAFSNWTLDGEIVSTESTYTFTVTGSVNFTANFDVVHSQQLASGWNWFSTYLDITLDDLKAKLVEALPGTSITIMSQTNGNTTYNAGRWRGNLNALDAAQMYMIKTSSNCEITLTGVPINPTEHPALIHNGFNWIAFPFSESKSLNEAFAGFAVNGDMVMSQFNSAVYYGNSWRGALNILEPGQGYMYKSNVQGDRTFTFPISTK